MAATTRTTLFCIPHAGGSAFYYSKLGGFFPDWIVPRPLELPGRGSRSREPLLTSMEGLSRDLFTQMALAATGAPYAIFGHSMGALLAHLCTLLAQEEAAPLPSALFLSGATVPGTQPSRLPGNRLSSLPPDQLWDSVVKMGGVPPGIAESVDFRLYLEPVLYADFTAVETWVPVSRPPVPVPIVAFHGSEDIVTGQDAKAWSAATSLGCSVHSFHGNHFYLQDHWRALAEIIARTLAGSPA